MSLPKPQSSSTSDGDNDTSGNKNLSNAGVGGTTNKELQPYALVLYNLYGRSKFTPQELKWANLCKARKWPSSAFLLMIKRFDPNYRKTEQYKNSIGRAVELWQKYFPRLRAPHGILDDWARSAMQDQTSLMRRFERTPEFKRLYPYYKLAQARNPQAGYNPETYRTYRQELNRAYQLYLGRPASSAEHKMFFSAGMTPADIQQALPEIMGGNEAFRWAFGQGYDQKNLNKMIYRRPGAAEDIAKLAGANQMRQSFMKSQARPFGLTQNENEDIVSPRI